MKCNEISSFGTLLLDHNVSQLFVMPQLTIAERQFLVEHYFKSYWYGRAKGSVVMSQEPLMNFRRTLLEWFLGIGQETLSSLFGNMLTCLEVCVDQNGWAFIKLFLSFNVFWVDFVFKYNSFTLQQIKSLFYENILFTIKKVLVWFFLDHPVEWGFWVNFRKREIMRNRSMYIYASSPFCSFHIIKIHL